MIRPPALVLLALACLAAPARADRTSAELRGDDALGRAGRSVTLRAKLERRGIMGINPDVSGEPLDFWLIHLDGKPLPEARFVGSGETDGNGFATLEWQAEEPGCYGFEVRVRKGSSYVALPAPLVVAVPAPERPVIAVQLDTTVSLATNLQMFRGKPNEEIPAVDGAAQILSVLASQYQLVYLTDLDASFTGKFKDWLALRGIPPAPVVFWELFDGSLSHAAYMEQVVKHVKEQAPQLTLGIGGQLSDAEAFRAHGLVAVVVAREEPAARPSWALWARDWARAMGHVVQRYRAEKLLAAVAGSDPAAASQALEELARLGLDAIGYVAPWRRDPDPNLAAAANLVGARANADEAFFLSLPRSSAQDALCALVAAWREGNRAVVERLHRDRAAARELGLPRFVRCEQVSRQEPEPGKVIIRVRLLAGDGAAETRQLVLVEDQRTWWVDAEERLEGR